MNKRVREKADLSTLVFVVKEFLSALRQNRTYDIRKNWYSLFGILWGLPIPIVTISIDLYASALKFNTSNVFDRVIAHPIHFFFLLHPLIFGIVFGAMGTVRYNKDMKIKEYEKSLIGKNKELEDVNDKLLELEELKSNFLKMVSHELRTPLTTILGYISFLKTQKSGRLTKEQLENLSLSEEEALRLDSLIEELLDITKIETGTFKVNLQNTDILEITERAVKSFIPIAQKNRIDLRTELPEELPNVLADKDKLLQVISNLIENGIKFNKPGGKVIVSAEISDNNKIIININDTGIGIEQEKIKIIFEKFYQVDSDGKRKYGGCGLGLAISESIVRLHNGKIWVESKIGEGSRFHLELSIHSSDKNR